MKSSTSKRPSLGAHELAKIQAAMASNDQPKGKEHLLADLIRQYRSPSSTGKSSPEWEALAATTKRTWAAQLNLIQQKWGNVPLTVFDDRRMTSKIVAWRDSRAQKPRGADLGIMVLRTLLDARMRALLSINPATGIKPLYRGANRAEIIWTEDQIEQFAKVAASLGQDRAADALRLASLTGLRRADLVELRWSDIDDNAISMKTAKVSRGKRYRITVPVVDGLKELLAQIRAQTTSNPTDHVLLNERGLPWVGDTLTKAISRVRGAAGIVQVDPDSGEKRFHHLHDARGTFATRLMRLTDITDDDIAEIMGWSSDQVRQIRRVYVDRTAIVMALAERARSRSV